jgi:hypothetical protein
MIAEGETALNIATPANLDRSLWGWWAGTLSSTSRFGNRQRQPPLVRFSVNLYAGESEECRNNKV